MRAGWGCWGRGGGTPSWVSTIVPKHLFPFPAGRSPFRSSAWARALVHPYSCNPGPSVTVSTSLHDGPDHLLPPPGSGRLPASLFQSLPSIPPAGSLVWPHSYLLSCGLHTCFGFPPPKHTLLFTVGLTSPPRRPSSLPSSPFPVCSKPGGFIPLSIQGPQVPGHPSPSPCPATLGFSVSRPANPHYSLCPHQTSPHQGSPISTSPYLACRAPAPPCRAPPGAGGGRRRDRERPGGAELGPAAETAPPPGPPPDPPPAPNPPFHTLQGRSGSGRAALRRQAGVGGTGDAEPAEPAGGDSEKGRGGPGAGPPPL